MLCCVLLCCVVLCCVVSCCVVSCCVVLSCCVVSCCVVLYGVSGLIREAMGRRVFFYTRATPIDTITVLHTQRSNARRSTSQDRQRHVSFSEIILSPTLQFKLRKEITGQRGHVYQQPAPAACPLHRPPRLGLGGLAQIADIAIM